MKRLTAGVRDELLGCLRDLAAKLNDPTKDPSWKAGYAGASADRALELLGDAEAIERQRKFSEDLRRKYG